MPAANAAISAKATTIAVSQTANGTYTILAYAHTFGSRNGQGNEDSIYFYGSSTPLSDVTAAEQTISINLLLNMGDSAQNLVRSNLAAGTPIFVRVLQDGLNGYQRQVSVRNYAEDGDANGTGINKFVRCSFDLVGSGTVTAIVAP